MPRLDYISTKYFQNTELYITISLDTDQLINHKTCNSVIVIYHTNAQAARMLLNINIFYNCSYPSIISYAFLLTIAFIYWYMIHFSDIRNLIKAYYHIFKLCTCIYIYIFLYI